MTAKLRLGVVAILVGIPSAVIGWLGLDIVVDAFVGVTRRIRRRRAGAS
jgi:ABC-type phosphate transport system permease subunit